MVSKELRPCLQPSAVLCMCLAAQLCLPLCNPMDCRPPGSSVCEILQARTLECVAMPSSRGSSWLRNWTYVSCVSGIAGSFFYSAPTRYIIHSFSSPNEVLTSCPSCFLVAKSCPTLCDPMDYRLSLSVGFPRQEYWSRLPFATPGDLLDPGIKPRSPALASGFFTTEPLGKPMSILQIRKTEGQASSLQELRLGCRTLGAKTMTCVRA